MSRLEPDRKEIAVDDLDFVLFGATGDLAMRKLFPSLYEAFRKNFLPINTRIIATSRSVFDTQNFIDELEKKAKIHITNCENERWQNFIQKIKYLSINTNESGDFKALEQEIADKNKNIVIYFSISPEFFIKVCENLASIGLNRSKTRIILEKPLGMDLKSCQNINNEVAKYYREEQIYRIDHYLGKQSVQNILILRAYNPIFASLWNKHFIDHIQVTAFETLGVENRGEFYDKTGALRDMVQNHILQILSLLAMKIPSNLNADSIRMAKCEILKKIKPPTHIDQQVIRAQYTQNKGHKSYIDESNIAPKSKTESFVAFKLEFDDEDWLGVPFYVRTGKRMADAYVQIVVVFQNDTPYTNKLIINLQPKNELCLKIAVKNNEGYTDHVEQALKFTQEEAHMKPYESLILDAIRADATSFNHKDELEMAWIWADKILEYFNRPETPLYHYKAGSFGPKEAFLLIQKDGREWFE